MADLTAKLILYRVNETLSHLAERVESFFCGPDGSPDVLSMFFIGWILLGILVYFLGSFIARRLDRLKSRTPAIPTTEPVSEKVIVPVESTNTHVKPPSSGGSSTSAPQPSSARPKGTRRAVPASSDEEDVLAPVPMSFAGRALPVADGPDSHSAKWANQVLGYLFSEPGAKNPNLTESWLLALNQQTLKAAPQHGLLVEFNSVSVNMLNLREVMVSPETGNNVTVHCRGLAEGLTFMVTATRNTGQARATQDFEVYMDRLDGKLKTLCNTEDSLLVVRFLEKPDTMVNIKAHGTPQNWALPNQQHVEDLIHEIVLQSLTSSTIDLPYDREPAFPKYQKPKPPPPRPPPAAVANSHVAGDAHHHVPQQQQKLGESASPTSGAAQHQQRLLVKIIKADNLAQDKPCAEPYCVVEMDDPAQRFQTSALPNTHSPFWGEHFLFSLKNSSAELLFEIFDRGKGNQFLGLGIVSVDELQKNPSQRQVLKLRPRPTHLKEIVTGTLTVEFLFMEGSEVPVKGLVEKNSRLTKTGALITTTTIQKPQEDFACLGGSRDSLDSRWFPPIIPLPDHTQYLLPKTLERDRSLNSLDQISSDSEFIGPLDNDEQDGPTAKILNTYKCWDCDNPCGDSTELIPTSSDSESELILPDPPSDIPTNEHPDHKTQDPFDIPTNEHPDHKTQDPFDIPTNEYPDYRKQDLFDIPTNEYPDYRTQDLFEIPTNEHPDYKTQDPFDIPMTPFIVESIETASPDTLASFLNPEMPNGMSSQADVVTVPCVEFPPDHQSSSNGPVTEVLSPTPLPVPTTPEPVVTKDTTPKAEEGNVVLRKPEKTRSQRKPKSWFKAKKVAKSHKDDDSGSLANDSLADAALQELERNAGVGKQTSKSTLIIHSVQRELVRPTIQVKMDRDGKWHEVAQTNGESPSAGTAGPSTEGQGPEEISPYGTMNSEDLNRSRTKDRKSSLMGALRKRLSFKKNRSKSMDQRSAGDRPEMIDGQEDISGRSISADRSSRNKDTPSGPHHLNVTGARLDAGSTRSSLSEGSGFSGASSRTYINENSTLVIELNENGLTKHYLIPYSLAARSKWRKRGGLKLHIYNDHTFVAKHIPGSEQCQVCQRKFSRRPGKQGYGCRDCGLQCHKTCHVKVESRCPNSTIQSLEMEYVQDPRARPKALPS